MKRIPSAFLLSLILLAGPAAGAPGGRGEQRAERAQARMERQAARQQGNEQRAARQVRAERARAERQGGARHQQQRAERRQAVVSHQQQRAVRRQAAASRQQARTERRQATVARHQERDPQRVVARQQRRSQHLERRQIAAEQVLRQQREMQRQRHADRQRRQGEAAAHLERRQDVFQRQELSLAQQRALLRQRQNARGGQRQAVADQRRMAQQRLDERWQRRQERQDLAWQQQSARQQQRELRAVRQQQRAAWNRGAATRSWLPWASRSDRTLARQQQRALAREQRAWPAPRRFRGLDFDRDGVISRAEWRGNDRSFFNHDWNGDGLLSGSEVVPAGARVPRVNRFAFVERFMPLPQRFVGPVPLMVAPLGLAAVELVPLPPLAAGLPLRLDENHWERLVRVQGFGPLELVVSRVQLTPVDRVLVDDRFLSLDLDRNRYVNYDEWTGSRPLFRQLDLNRDDLLVPAEMVVTNPRVRTVTMVDRERYVAFNLLDEDDDGVIAPWEWTGDMDVFFLLDADGNGVLGQAEYLGLVPTRPVPLRLIAGGGLDLDRNGYVGRSEWVGDPYRFVSLDLDGDGRVKPVEALAGYLINRV